MESHEEEMGMLITRKIPLIFYCVRSDGLTIRDCYLRYTASLFLDQRDYAWISESGKIRDCETGLLIVIKTICTDCSQQSNYLIFLMRVI